MEVLSFLFFCFSVFPFFRISMAGDTITPNQSINDSQTLVSAGGSFELGFFSPGNSKNRYLGIWYKKISTGTVVWVANREIPITDSYGVLKMSENGNLVLDLNRTENAVWSSNSSRTVQNPVAQLLESGNLVVKDGNDDNSNNFLWQSFDYPSDTLLPGMKFGWNLKTGLNRFISSWKSIDDPSPGDYSYGIDTHGFPQLVLRKGPTVQYRAGSWNGLRFSGTPELKPNPIYDFKFISNEEEVYFIYELWNESVVSKLVVNQSGTVKRFTWIDRNHGWDLFLSVQIDNCDNYADCGPYGSCNINNLPVCECLKGFVPKSQQDWSLVDFADGCIRRTPLDCEKGDGFLKYTGVKLPDTSGSWVNNSMSLIECKEMCLKNCSCTAYANSDIRRGGSGCLLWFGNLIDIRVLSDNGQDLYIRMAASELEHINGDSNNKKRATLIVTGVLISGVLFFGIWCIWKKSKTKKEGKMPDNQDKDYTNEGPNEDLELPLFDLATISTATNNFSFENKLGEGGFGPVYKGMLGEEQEIAVKRLSKNSGQGPNEFKNEVILIAKLQHRNLVKILGCCIQGEEKMLIYEYMPNKSLDCFIFDQARNTVLDWKKRYNIIGGIARGLLYLHQDSRLRIIHRDLKASNILLDNEMNPKISDFGIARTFGGDQTEANTSRVVGTYGYMSPEYAIDGLFSVKSDVYSFGVLVLEIVSGKRNRGFFHPHHYLNLLGHAWTLWKEGKSLELIDASLRDSCNLSQVLRCIHVGLLCVQQYPEDRPSMSAVVLMLGSEIAKLPQPKQPGFFTERNPIGNIDSSSSKQESCTANEITITLLEAR